MYKVLIKNEEVEIDAGGLNVENGTLMFTSTKNDGIRCVIPAGEWQCLKVGDEHDALQIRKAESVPAQPCVMPAGWEYPKVGDEQEASKESEEQGE